MVFFFGLRWFLFSFVCAWVLAYYFALQMCVVIPSGVRSLVGVYAHWGCEPGPVVCYGTEPRVWS